MKSQRSRTRQLIRNTVKRIIPKSILGRLVRPWVIAERSPRKPIPIDSFALHAIIGSWMEADIIEATVRNAFAQGVERVFLIDNDSPDDTVDRAKRAGAEHVFTYSSRRYDEAQRIGLMAEFTRRTSESGHADHVWWLWLDADEFPRPQSGGTLRSLLESLDRRFRVIGARFLNHFPSPGRLKYVRGRHPIDYQPLCEELKSTMCWEQHRKHPLLRWDRDKPTITPTLGFHSANCATRPLVEPSEPIVIHHFPFREEDASRARLERLFGGDQHRSRARESDIAVAHMRARRDSLNAVYKGDWRNVDTAWLGERNMGVTLVDWRELNPAVSPDIPLWYTRSAGSA